MGRSVSRPRDAAFVAYGHLAEPDDEDMAAIDWADFLESLRAELSARYPSLYTIDEWPDNEDHAILENGHCMVGVSEYCGIVSFWAIPASWDGYGREDNGALGARWLAAVEKGMREVFARCLPGEALVPMGTFSNGEQVFRPAERPEGVVTSKEGTLW